MGESDLVSGCELLRQRHGRQMGGGEEETPVVSRMSRISNGWREEWDDT